MAKLIARPDVILKVVIELDEAEARALDAVVGYGVKPFLDVFYKNLGQAYLQPHEDGLVRLFESLRKILPPQLSAANRARKIFLDRD